MANLESLFLNKQLYRIEEAETGEEIISSGALTFLEGVQGELQSENIISGEILGDIIMKGGRLESSNFVTGSAGWQLTPDSAEFNVGVAVESIDIPDTTTSNSFHVNSSGDSWWGANNADFTADNDNANAYVLKDGSAKFQSVTIEGATVSTFNGSLIGNVQERAENDYLNGLFRGTAVDGLNETVANSTITRGLLTTRMTNSTGGNWRLDGQFGAASKDAATQYDWDNDFEFFARIQADAGSVDTGLAGASMYWGLADAVLITTALGTNGTTFTTANMRHVGFFVGRDSQLYSSTADGSGQTINSIAGVTHTNENEYRIVFLNGVSAAFYVNDVLKDTIITNLPSGATNPPRINFQGVVGINTANLISFLLFNNYKVIKT
jgi:hypothetical protein